MTGIVHIVHAIDTEGPLYESIEARFEHLGHRFGISDIEPTESNLGRLLRGEIDLGPQTQTIQEALKNHSTKTLGSWDQLNSMLERVCTDNFRRRLLDCDGNGWVYNWFCMDHIGFSVNPRKRDMGYHNIYDRYLSLVNSQPGSRDCIEFHFHPISTYREAHRCATHYLRTDDLYQILCRKIIEREFFPSSYRAGFQAERPDSHWFLEQFIPFDISNMATEDTSDIDGSVDFKKGRSGNWRKAPHDWSVYHPSHDDYQMPGSCRRFIGRALNLNSRIASMTQEEMNRAFRRAESGMDTIVGLASHDWRDLEPEVDLALEFLKTSQSLFPDVPFRFSRVGDAFRTQLTQKQIESDPLELSLSFHCLNTENEAPYLEVRTEKGKVFGPQPFLAIKTKAQKYIHDNFDFSLEEGVWYYAFHADTLALSDVEVIAIAANDLQGNTKVLKKHL